MGRLWFELNNRRPAEDTIGYCESHDQALVGDQTLIFRLIGSDMYGHMGIGDPNLRAERGLALHKMIRLITLATAGHGYLNFMGNEFGHPEWIDFPRAANQWSFRFARRQWHLADDPGLRYRFLAAFDRDMLALAADDGLLADPSPQLRHEHDGDKILAFSRGRLLFVFNFHWERSQVDYRIGAPAGRYRMVLDSDAGIYGGHGRLVADQVHLTRPWGAPGTAAEHGLSLYLPTRTAVVLRLN